MILIQQITRQKIVPPIIRMNVCEMIMMSRAEIMEMEMVRMIVMDMKIVG
jgi:hypothetical protein